MYATMVCDFWIAVTDTLSEAVRGNETELSSTPRDQSDRDVSCRPRVKGWISSKRTQTVLDTDALLAHTYKRCRLADFSGLFLNIGYNYMSVAGQIQRTDLTMVHVVNGLPLD